MSAALTLAASCGGPGAVPARSSPPAPTDPYQQTFIDGARCPVASGHTVGVPDGSGCVSSASGDFDGNGTSDRFVVFAALDTGGLPLSWSAEAMLGTTSTAQVPLAIGAAVLGSPDVYPRVVGAADADGDGRMEAFVQLSADVYHVAVQPIDGIFAVRDGRIQQVTLGGDPFVFRTNGISRFGQGAVCGSADGEPVLIVGRVGQAAAGWVWTEQTYRWKGLALVPAGTRTGSFPISLPVNDPRVWHYYRLICGAIDTI